jgi:hypothetical protein
MRIIIAGGRDFDDYPALEKYCDQVILVYCDPEIVSGGARGADRLGEEYAEKRGLPIRRFPADWDAHGRRAGFLRNAQMARYADVLIAFWDGKSKGTQHMIGEASRNGLETFIYRY